MDEKKKEFISKLKELLREYNADIEFYADGDTHCVQFGVNVEINGEVVHENGGMSLEI